MHGRVGALDHALLHLPRNRSAGGSNWASRAQGTQGAEQSSAVQKIRTAIAHLPFVKDPENSSFRRSTEWEQQLRPTFLDPAQLHGFGTCCSVARPTVLSGHVAGAQHCSGAGIPPAEVGESDTHTFLANRLPKPAPTNGLRHGLAGPICCGIVHTLGTYRRLVG